MNIVKTTVYKTSDGTMFDTLADAEKHERTSSLLQYWDNAKVYWREPDPTELASLALEWMDRMHAPGVKE